MRTRFLAVAAAFVLTPLAAQAAPMSTSDLLKPQLPTEQAWCKRYCHHYGYCGYGYKKYRCCKVWKQHCSYRPKKHYH